MISLPKKIENDFDLLIKSQINAQDKPVKVPFADDAINNISNRVQQSFGGDFQWTLKGEFFGYNGQLILGGVRAHS